MADRKTYLYRLDVATYPEGSHDERGWPVDGWEPRGWQDDPANWGMDWETGAQECAAFSWPDARRRFLSRAGAAKRAYLLCKYGATVTIVRSNPVTWPEVDHA